MCRLFVLLQMILLPLNARSWDLAIAVNDHLELMNVTSQGEKTIDIVDFQQPLHATALAFDPVRNLMFVSDTQSKKPSAIYSVRLQDSHEIKLVVQEPMSQNPEERHRVLGIAYDHVTDTLFWTNGVGKAILRLHPKETNNERSVLLQLNKITTGIALDICSRTLYWTTKNGTIERSDLDGSNHKVIFTGLHNPKDITVDQKLRKLYWCDDAAGIYFRIERSNLDGTSRQGLRQHINQKPFSIATTASNIYWTNIQSSNLWSIPTHITNEPPINLVHQFKSDTMGIISQDNSIRYDECNTHDSDLFVSDEPAMDPAINGGLKERSKVGVETSVPISLEGFCLNGGTFGKEDPTRCKCLSGFAGLKCEESLCYNYCINGNCYIDSSGFPQCVCLPGYHGERCEHDVCENFCLNSGRCDIIEGGNPVCKCGGDYQGKNCEINCVLHCQHNQVFIPLEGDLTPLCPCSEDGRYDTGENTSANAQFMNGNLENGSECPKNDYYLQSILIGLGSVCCVLVLLLVLLVKKVLTLRKRPRIKKRIIVNKNVTPLTSRPPPPDDQCEITIENCCNMNICETPCYEPELRTSAKMPSKTEEKKNLLGNMEEGTSCSPCQDNLY